MSNTHGAATAVRHSAPPLRVMVVDDSAVIRGFLTRFIEAESDMVVAASLRTGREAVKALMDVKPDVVVLDVDMPDMDGLAALPLLIAQKRDLIVIMASTLTRRNAEISFKALSKGAADYLPKPETSGEIGGAGVFRRDLIEKIRAFGRRGKGGRAGLSSACMPGLAGRPTLSNLKAAAADARLAPFALMPPRVILIGASTGGPQALATLMPEFGPVIDRCPLLITQHMPPTFTTILAEHLERVSGRMAREALHGEAVKAGRIYVAPGGKHMRVARRGGEAVIVLDDGPHVNYCRPAVDPLFQSAAKVWQAGVLAVVLTGMGADGANGAKDIAAAGGSVIAQDKATSVVWGMPSAAFNAGACAAVLPLNEISPAISRLVLGVSP